MSYFGHAPVRSYHSKLRYIVGALSAVVMTLVTVLIFVLSNSSIEKPNLASGNAWAAVPNQTDILVSRGRIEQGMQVEATLLSTLAVPTSDIPQGALLATKQTEIIGAYAKQLIPAGAFIQPELFSHEIPVSSETIPPGMRAVTINVDSRAGVAGHVTAFSRVDVLCTYEKQGSKEIGVVVPYAKVFSVNTDPTGRSGNTSSKDSNTVTLVVKEEDALRIELARTVGALSLNLVGNTTEIPNFRQTNPLSQKKLFDNEPEIPETIKIDGRLTMISPKDGKLVVFVLIANKWQEERDLHS